MNDLRLFKDVKNLFLDNVNTICMHEGENTEYELNLSTMRSEERLLEAIFQPEYLDDLIIDGVMVSGKGFAVSAPYCASNLAIMTNAANKFGIKIKKVSYL